MADEETPGKEEMTQDVPEEQVEQEEKQHIIESDDKEDKNERPAISIDVDAWKPKTEAGKNVKIPVIPTLRALVKIAMGTVDRTQKICFHLTRSKK